MIVTVITLIALAVILVVCCFLLWAKNYEEGIVGHIALVGMALASIVVLISAAHGTQYDFLPTSVMLIVSGAIFMARHAYRFLRFSCDGRYSWKKRDLA